MLSDILGVMIAFVSIILLLSILVTALVQFAQAALQLRARNLRRGLADLFRQFEAAQREDGAATGDEGRTPARYLALANEVLNAPRIALMDRAAGSGGGLQRLFRSLTGPSVSWVDPAKLPEAIEAVMAKWEGTAAAAQGETRAQAEALTEAFKDSYPLLQRRFQLRIRHLTFAIAFLVAFAFQLSTPQLLGELREDAERRAAVAAGADRLLASADLRRLDPGAVATEALQALQAEYPEQSARIGQARSIGGTRPALVAELALALGDAPERDQILGRYEGLLDSLVQARLETARDQARGARNQLAEQGVFLWPEGRAFYFTAGRVGLGSLRIDALLGVLVTAILLSLGAPFWYEMLRNLVNLRDTLSGKTGRSSRAQDARTGA